MIKHYINGEWVASVATESVDVINPANGKLLAQCPLGTAADVDRAVAAAQAAFTQWRRVPAVDRVQPLFKLKSLLEAHVDDLATSVTMEHGKTVAEAKGSVRRAIQMVETACAMPSLMMGECAEDIATGIDCQAVRRPMGVFAGIVPFNFPAMVPFWFWPFAVACGNTFVVKPSERVPLTQGKMFELIAQAGFPKGVISMVNGGKVVVDRLCTHPDIKGVSFVGSTPVAEHVYKTATAQLKRVQALGGAKNCMIALPDAPLDKSAHIAFESITGCAGERCLAGSVVICVGDETYRQFAQRMVPLAKDTNVGDGLDTNTQMGPLISAAAKTRVQGLIQSAVDEGAELLVDGRLNVDQLPGYFLRPTIIGHVQPQMRVAKEEIFGPVVCLAKVQTFDEAIAWMNALPFANTATLFTTNGAAARKFCYEAHPSMLGINIGVPAPMAFFSFGGSKHSFYGDIKAHGKACVNFYTDTVVAIKRWGDGGSIW